MSRPDIPVTISGTSKGFEGTLARVRAMAKTTAGDVTASFLAIKSKIGGVGTFLAAAGVTAAIGAVRDAASAIAEIGVEARKAGVDIKSFQELKYVAEQNKIGIDALADGLKELSLRADEFIVTGGGAAAESFQRLGFNASQLKEKLKDPSALFTEIIGKLERLDKAAQIRILDEIFGGAGGEQFLQLIKAGEKGIRDTIKAAHDLGLVFETEMVEKAAEVDRKFNALATVVSTKLKGAIVEAATSLATFLDLLNDVDDRQTSTLKTQLNDKKALLAKTERSSAARFVVDGAHGEGVANLKKEIDELETLVQKRDALVTTPGASPKAGRVQSAREILRGKLIDQKVASAFDTPSSTSGSEKSRTGSAKAAKEEEAAYVGVIKSLKEELELIGKSDVEREKMTSLREAEVSATSKEGQEIEKLIELKYRQQAAEDALQEKREQAQQAAEEFGATLDDQLGNIIDGTFDAKDALAALIQELMNAATGGKGIFSSLFGSFFNSGAAGATGAAAAPSGILGFGGPRAAGGNVSPGRIYQINEKEQELFMPGVHGSIVPPSKMGGNAMSISFAPQIDARGASVESVARLEQALARQQADFTANVVTTIRKANQGGTKFGKFH